MVILQNLGGIEAIKETDIEGTCSQAKHDLEP